MVKAPFWRRLYKELLEPVLFAVIVTQFLGTLVGVSGASMMPNLRSGERVLVPKYETWLHKAGLGDFKRGDILIFKPPTQAVNEDKPFLNLWTYRPFLIKRLIGLPGDTVRVDGGEVYVNGKQLDGGFTTSYWKTQGCWDTGSKIANNAQSGREYAFLKTAREFVVPPGHYFLMGDNRTANGSEDSRSFGPVARRDIAGRAAVVVWPPFRKTNATYDCAYRGPRPQDRVQFSGPNQLNWRLLRPPAAFAALKNSVLSRAAPRATLSR